MSARADGGGANAGAAVAAVASQAIGGFGAKKADSIAKHMGIEMSGYSTYRVGGEVAELRVPDDGLFLQRTSNISNNLAQALQESMPFALPFELVKWFTPDKATKSPSK